jgi:hypothetical protein
LGVTQLNPHKICEAILEKQEKKSFLPSADELLSQALFLYSMNYRSELLRKIWLIAEDGESVQAGDLYADISVRSHVEGEKTAVIEYPARFFYDRVKGCKSFKFLHRRFLHPGNVDDVGQWHRYLHYNLHVAYSPRLVQFADGDKTTFSLHNNFAQVVKGSNATQWLSLLRNHWRLYSEWLENDETEDDSSRWNRCRGQLRENLGATEVSDVNGKSHPLKDTFLPLSNLVNRYNGIVPFLDINNPDDPVWQTTLRPFGVGTADNLHFYLKILQGASSMKLNIDKISDILAQIQARSRDDEVRVRWVHVPWSAFECGRFHMNTSLSPDRLIAPCGLFKSFVRLHKYMLLTWPQIDLQRSSFNMHTSSLWLQPVDGPKQMRMERSKVHAQIPSLGRSIPTACAAVLQYAWY